jgi:hypothetical protein
MYFILLLIIVVILSAKYYDKIKFYFKQLYYLYLFRKDPLKDNWNNNQMTLIRRIPLKICFITMESRKELEFVKLHNQNLKSYVDIQNQKNLAVARTYSYHFFDQCQLSNHKHNVYWCKLFLAQEALKSNQYDYVIWLDSDTIIIDPNLDIGDIITSFQSDFLVAPDQGGGGSINAGVLIFKNSPIALEMLEKMTNIFNSVEFQQQCLRSDLTLNGIWANTCYEQGILNLISLDYKEHLTLLTTNIINHRYAKTGFIINMSGRTSEDRAREFKSLMFT